MQGPPAPESAREKTAHVLEDGCVQSAWPLLPRLVPSRLPRWQLVSPASSSPVITVRWRVQEMVLPGQYTAPRLLSALVIVLAIRSGQEYLCRFPADLAATLPPNTSGFF